MELHRNRCSQFLFLDLQLFPTFPEISKLVPDFHDRARAMRLGHILEDRWRYHRVNFGDSAARQS